jgi:hypothetical protein
MNDMSSVIVPKSDQLNAEDFISGPRTFTIDNVEIRSTTEQPVSVYMAGEQRVWRPCKSMSRVLVSAWGPDARKYVGRSLTLYRDPKVKWGGLEVGGIRVSHMTDIERDFSMALTETKGKRTPFMVRLLKIEQPRARKTADEWATDHIAFVTGAASLERLAEVQNSGKAAMDKLGSGEVFDRVKAAYAKRFAELSGDDSDVPFGRADSDHGDQHDGTDDNPANGRIEVISGEGGK